MIQKFIPFALPDIGEEEISAVSETLRSLWVTTGPKTREFEHEFVNYLGGNLEAISVNSATAGLHLALEACGIKSGDEVIIPTLTFTATAEVIRYLGANPIFIDCDPQTLNIDIDQIEAKITHSTRAIIPVHFAGLACDMPKILTIAKKYNLRVIEDAAHTLPGKFNNVMIGQHNSDAIVYSFYATKTITTGEGGMIVTKNSEIAKRCRIMRLHGISRDAFDRYTSTAPSWYYEVVAPGYKYNLTDIASTLGLCQLAKANKFHQRRTQMAKKYQESLKDLPIKLPPVVANTATDIHSWHLFVINLLPEAKINRDKFIARMSEKGIGTSVHFIPLHMQPYWKNEYNLQDTDFPHATKNYAGSVSLPLYTKLTDTDHDYIIATIRQILN
ncbi:MAG: UDP-4-amino-4,6-dideoxy-N-acetyl-beta-L-altrosamine transaminase [Burkholderiales bacterium]|jgi:dTDP-4-amino-4,6-dideoxygalactose transaminase|nr:UDP-4-amino-4,6-dideoxy-N-acetyl-beta-L-altrosamine transaminase [Burkholderiales bacterium]